jgi:hypothetical protein
MHVDALAVKMRPRSASEACDLGVRLCQHAARSVFPCYAIVAAPVIGIALASAEIAIWLPFFAIWLSKAWLDRTILFVLSRAAFGQETRPADLWRSRRAAWGEQFFFTWIFRRYSPCRSYTQPVYQLEGVSPWKARARVRQICRRGTASAFLMTQVFALSELSLTFGLLSLLFWFAPPGQSPELIDPSSPTLWFSVAGAYAITVFFLEPFYVAAGFAMYLNRRAELEAWDIEQEFRRAFAH